MICRSKQKILIEKGLYLSLEKDLYGALETKDTKFRLEQTKIKFLQVIHPDC